MKLKITSLRIDSRKSELNANGGGDVPYLMVNATWKFVPCDDDTPEDSFLYNIARGEAEDYHKVLTIESPESYEKWLLNWDFNFDSSYEGYKHCWTQKEGAWQYIEKFDTFWFREWIADSVVTKALLNEIVYYKSVGEMLSKYRTVDGQIILKHFSTLHSYWD